MCRMGWRRNNSSKTHPNLAEYKLEDDYIGVSTMKLPPSFWAFSGYGETSDKKTEIFKEAGGHAKDNDTVSSHLTYL